MIQEFKLPDLGEGITGGDVVQVLVKEGDAIKAEQPVVEIETDKAVLEVPCPFAGKIAKIHVKQGEKAKVGAPLISVETDQAAAAPSKSAPPPEPKQETKKASEEPKPKAAAEQKPPPAKPVAAKKPEPVAEEPPPPKKSAPPSAPPKPVAADEEVAAGPSTRRMARELGIDLNDIAAAYPGQRITEEHIKAFSRDQGGGGSGTAPVREPPMPEFSQWGEVERVALSSLQRKSAEHVALAWSVCPHVTQFDSADVTALDALRKRYRKRGPNEEIKLTVTAFVLKALAAALKTYPMFNATLDTRTNELVLKKYYHIGVAVDTEAGLIVPVLRDVDKKRVLEIAIELDALAERTRHRKVKPDELRGGTFTVTNLGGIGGTAFTPIINHPEVAILGLARSKEEPMVENGQLRTRLMLPLCLSYDHRVINGADGARFMRKVASLLEDPELLLLEG